MIGWLRRRRPRPNLPEVIWLAEQLDTGQLLDPRVRAELAELVVVAAAAVHALDHRSRGDGLWLRRRAWEPVEDQVRALLTAVSLS